MRGGGKGSPSSLKPPRPPQPYIDFSYTLCTRWRGLGLWPWRGGWGQGGGGKPLLNRHLYIYINNFSVHRQWGEGEGVERAWEVGGESNFELCPLGAARTHPDQRPPPFPSDGAQGLTPEGTVLSPFLVQGGGGFPPQARVGSPAAAVGLCLGQQVAEGVKELFQPRLIPHALLDYLLLAQVLCAALDGQGLVPAAQEGVVLIVVE